MKLCWKLLNRRYWCSYGAGKFFKERHVFKPMALLRDALRVK